MNTIKRIWHYNSQRRPHSRLNGHAYALMNTVILSLSLIVSSIHGHYPLWLIILSFVWAVAVWMFMEWAYYWTGQNETTRDERTRTLVAVICVGILMFLGIVVPVILM